MLEPVADLSRLRTQLDESQRLAVCKDPSDPLLIFAGAGSGKTLTMASRIAFIMLNGVSPEHILGLCFSRKAAESLRERVAAVLPDDLAPLAMRLKLKTFHAFGLECLRRFGRIDLSTEVYDAQQQHNLVEDIVRDHKNTKDRKVVNTLNDYVSKVKTKKSMHIDKAELLQDEEYLFDCYQIELHEKRGAVDFGDLEQMLLEILQSSQVGSLESDANRNNTAIFMQKNLNGGNRSVPSDIARRLHAQYTHVFVDEFQDLNEVEFECLTLLAGEKCRVTCVGDPNQCIYTWRGAIEKIFEQWCNRFPQTQVVKLLTNYRSSSEIVDVVTKVSQAPQESYKGPCGQRPTIIQCEHVCDQPLLIVRVVEEVLRVRNPKLTYGGIAVVCRTRQFVNDVIDALRRENIPVQELQPAAPVSQVLVRAMLSYLRLCIYPHSNMDVECVLRNAPNHFAAAAATRFVLSLQAECLDRRRRTVQTAEQQSVDSHALCSHYTILRELVHNGFAHVHDRLRTTKSQQKFLRTFIEVTTAAQDALGRPYCDIEEIVRSVVDRAGFDSGKASDVKIQRRAAGGVPCGFSGQSGSAKSDATQNYSSGLNNSNNNNNVNKSLDNEDPSASSISQLLFEACRTVQAQSRAEYGAPGNISQNGASQEPNGNGNVCRDAFTTLQCVIDEFCNFLTADDIGLQRGPGSADRNSEEVLNSNWGTSVTVTTVHQAKGREWPAVIVPGCYNGEFPINVRIDEEKRVFYVAMSRAIRDLVFLTAKHGLVRGSMNNNQENALQITPYLEPIRNQMDSVSVSGYNSSFSSCKEDC